MTAYAYTVPWPPSTNEYVSMYLCGRLSHQRPASISSPILKPEIFTLDLLSTCVTDGISINISCAVIFTIIQDFNEPGISMAKNHLKLRFFNWLRTVKMFYQPNKLILTKEMSQTTACITIFLDSLAATWGINSAKNLSAKSHNPKKAKLLLQKPELRCEPRNWDASSLWSTAPSLVKLGEGKESVLKLNRRKLYGAS